MRLVVVCLAALGGVVLGDVGCLEPTRLLVSGLVAALGVVLAWRRPAWRLLALAAVAAAVGGLRASTPAAEDAAVLEPYLGSSVRVRGRVVQPPTTGQASVQVVLDLEAIAPAGRDPPTLAEPARVRVVGDPAALEQVRVGHTAVLEGRLLPSDRSGPPTLVFPRLLDRGPPTALQPVGLLDDLRVNARAGIERWLPEPQASLAAGVLLGGSGRLDPEFRLQLQRSGLAHVVAIDGFKQVIVAGLLGGLVVPLVGRRPAALPVLLGLTGYPLLTGAHPAAVRAALMVGLATLASLVGRVADPLTSVVVAATIMAAFDPWVLLDVGLQLSLSATLGIVLLWPRLRRHLKRLPRGVAEPAGLTLAVTVASLPVTLSAFQLVSLVSPLAHIAAVPLLPLVLLTTALLALVAPVAAIAPGAAWLAWLPSTLLVDIIRALGSLPGAALSTGRLPPAVACGLAAALLVWGMWGLPETAALRRRLASAFASWHDVRRWSGLPDRTWQPVGLVQVRPTVRADEAGGAGWGLDARVAALNGSADLPFPPPPQARSGALGRLRVPAFCAAACLGAAALLHVVQPDGRLHVRHLEQARGRAVFLRGPTGRTLLVVGGRLDGPLLATEVAECLAVWEHRLDVVLALDPEAAAGLSPTLARYSAGQRLDAGSDARVDAGGGAALDVYANAGQQSGTLWLGFGQVQVPLFTSSLDEASPAQADLVSDGTRVWSAAADTQLGGLARLRSGPTTSAARPGSAD